MPLKWLQLSHLPCQVTEVRVDGAADDLAADVAELLCPVAESHDLSGAHKCEVQGVEEQDHILPCRAQKGQSKGHADSGQTYEIL